MQKASLQATYQAFKRNKKYKKMLDSGRLFEYNGLIFMHKYPIVKHQT